MSSLDSWWKSLKVADKERIATKIIGKTCCYPECSRVWLALEEDKKHWIQSHCEERHGIVMPDWTEGKVFSY